MNSEQLGAIPLQYHYLPHILNMPFPEIGDRSSSMALKEMFRGRSLLVVNVNSIVRRLEKIESRSVIKGFDKSNFHEIFLIEYCFKDI